MDDPKTVIYYNPRCSKCRSTLKLLQERGEEPEIIEYLQATPSRSELKEVLSLLGMHAGQLLRKKESAYREAGLNDASSEDEILDAMMKHPVLIERPIVVRDGKAAIGRPPENVLDIL